MVRSETDIQMKKDTKKRTDKRQVCNTKIKWAVFNRTTFNLGQERFYRARVLNFSEGGLYFESEHPLKPGTTILFRLEVSRCGASGSEGYDCLRTISLAEIRWCQDLFRNGESCFGIGAKYHIPY